MQLSDFDYELPAELIAQYPLANRTASRLLDLTQNSTEKSKAIFHDRIFTEIEELLLPGDLLIFNDTKVIPARLLGQKESGGKVEMMIERVIDDKTALTQIRSSKTPKSGQKIIVEHANLNPIEIVVLDRAPSTKGGEVSPFFTIAFPGDCLELLSTYGELPLPPYISHTPDDTDSERYQTVVAKHPGAVAAPTAGLHFDQDLLERLKNKGVQLEYVTLHVGAGTFSPVRSEDLSQHQMHFERFTIPQATRNALTTAKNEKRRIIAVGTTSLRALESSVLFGDQGDTNLFITPGYQFKVVDCLITNFHLPKSTLLMLVSAFVGYETIREAYQYAIEHQYRFFSYGDAMFLRRS